MLRIPSICTTHSTASNCARTERFSGGILNFDHLIMLQLQYILKKGRLLLDLVSRSCQEYFFINSAIFLKNWQACVIFILTSFKWWVNDGILQLSQN